MNSPYLVAVGGGSGSGKSAVVNQIVDVCQEKMDMQLLVLQQDHYYKDLRHLEKSERDQCNFDHPDALDMETMFQHLVALSQGCSIQRPIYDFVTHTRTRETVTLHSREIIIFDGIFAVYYEKLRPLFDLRLYVEVGHDIRMARRIKRDVDERGRTVDSVIGQYLTTVRPMHERYVSPSRSHADLVINWETNNDRAIHHICQLISFGAKNKKCSGSSVDPID